MTIYRCDRCKFESLDNKLTVIVIKLEGGLAQYSDLCDGCFYALKDWLKGN